MAALFLLPLLLAVPARSFWRMPCDSAVVARMDPLVNFNDISDHAHSIHGGSGFTINADFNAMRSSKCTSCAVDKDLSSYWAPALYFEHADGQKELVQEVGGTVVYYLLYGQNIKAFPAGFTMIAGDNRLRNFSWPVPDPPLSSWSGDQVSQPALNQKALGFNCLNYGRTPEPSLGRHFLPNKTFLDANCAHGIRLELMFPSCWNGKDKDSPTHKTHVAYPNLVKTGDCPPGFQTKLPTLFFETIWNTAAFAGKPGRFLLGNGDPTGYGYHGDFMTGWDVDFLQQAIQTCTNESGKIEDCPLFAGHIQTVAQKAACKIEVPPQLRSENVKGPMKVLPGNCPVQEGPAYANKMGAPTSDVPEPKSAVIPTAVASKPEATLVPTPTDKDQLGGIFAAKSSSSLSSSSPPPVAKIQEQNPPLPPPPSTTPPPPPSSTPSKTYAKTIIRTVSGVVVQEFVDEIIVYVTQDITATVSPTPIPHKHRRNVLNQHRGHRHAHLHR
ncbi:MAG: hypothetical protein M1814_004228 [Vezdaea aestivalis]|nr:MAG: hypothetical protein M1814_004228 [Vezdaea aestivalis]